MYKTIVMFILILLFLCFCIGDIGILLDFDWSQAENFNNYLSMLYLLPTIFKLIIKLGIINFIGICFIICK